MKLKEILAITGKPGLYRLVSRGNRMLIVESLDEAKKRMPAYASNQVLGLGDISVYVNDGSDIPLGQVFQNVSDKYEGKPVELDYKQASSDEMKEWMLGVLPNYDTDRVRVGDMKKMLQWYNILIKNGVDEFVEKKEEETEK